MANRPAMSSNRNEPPRNGKRGSKETRTRAADLRVVATSVDELMELAGTRGRWNMIVLSLACCCTFMSPLQTLSYEFLGATPDYWCHVEPLTSANWSQEQVIQLAIPPREGKGTHEKCLMYDYNYTLAAEMGYEEAVAVKYSVTEEANKTIPCDARDFNRTQYASTVVTQWDLVCERRALYSTTQAVSQFGNFIGSFFFGILLDTYGRRRVVLTCVSMVIPASFLTALSPLYGLYIFLQTFVACLLYGIYIGCFVVVMELSSPSQRSSLGSFFVIPWALGYMATPGIAYLVRTWQWLQAAFSLPLLLLLSYFWWLPETPRWLVQRGRYDEALQVLSWAARVNRRTLPAHSVLVRDMKAMRSKALSASRPEGSENICAKVLFLFTSRSLRRTTFSVMFCWVAASLVYYGISLNSANLSADPYLYVFLGGLVEIPSYLMLWPALIYLGRKVTLVVFYIVCTVCIFTLAALIYLEMNDMVTLLMVLSLSGKVAITAAFQLVYVYTAELFPTTHRSLAICVSGSMSRLASISAPYINDILGDLVTWAPAIVFGGLSCIASVLVLFLPETRNLALVEFTKADNSHEEEAKTTRENQSEA